MFFRSYYAPRLLLLSMLVLLNACAGRSAETIYYVLDSGEKSPSVTFSEKDYAKWPKLQLRQIDMPNYLDRNAIVTRENDGVRLNIASFDSWGESLERGAQRVMAEMLTPLLLKEKILLQPLDDRETGPLQIFIQVQRFDGPLDGSVVLDARWTVRDDNDHTLVSNTFVDSMPAGGTYTSLVQAQSTLLKRLAKSMVPTIANAF